METNLSESEKKLLNDEAKKRGFIAICTPFGENSVDLIEGHDYEIIKIATCLFTDWPLLEKITKTKKPIIASTAGVSLEDIDKVVSFAKPVGAWEGNFSCPVDKDDMDYMRELEKKYNVFTHMTPSYGMDIGCISVKRMVSVTKYGDVMPCPYIHTSLGNFFQGTVKGHY